MMKAYPTSELDRSIAAEQAKATLRGSRFTNLSGMAGIVTTMAAMPDIFSQPVQRALGLTLFGLYLARVGLTEVLRIIEHYRPVAVLWVSGSLALLSGCLWGALVLVSGDLVAGNHGFLFVMIAGISCGSLLQSTAVSAPAFCFITPALSCCAFSFASSGGAIGFTGCFGVVILYSMLARSGLESERRFRRGQQLLIDSLGLLRSLREAHDEVTAANERLHVMAVTDPLTGLSNRHAFALAMERCATEFGVPHAVLLLDVDRFKQINDTMGHAAGDEVLVEVSRHLREAAGPEAMVARQGGDEFAILLAGAEQAAQAERIAQEILDRLRTPAQLACGEVTVQVSIGYALHPGDADDPRDLLPSADIALYAAKQEGRFRARRFEGELRNNVERRRTLERDLPVALANGELTVYFQPQLHLTGREIIGVEALIRWNHPRLGWVSPPEIIASARALRLSAPLLVRIINLSCDMVKELDGLGLTQASVAINISPAEFDLISPAELLLPILKHRGIDPNRIEVEITEETMLDTRRAQPALNALEKAGVRLAVDDFGVGHASFAYLAALRIDRIKIDRSFVTDVDHNERQEALITALVGIGRSLGTDILAEGVETPAQAAALERLGCSRAQGYLFARPMPIGEVALWLHQHRQDFSPPGIPVPLIACKPVSRPTANAR